MFGLVVIVNIVALVATWDGNLRTGAIISLVAAIWSFGIASNFSTDPERIPNFAALMSIVAGLVGIVLAIAGFAS